MVLSRDVKSLKRIKSDPERFVLDDLQTHVLLGRLLCLEREVELLKLVAAIDVEPLTLDLPSAASLYESCLTAVGQKTHGLHELKMWTDIFAGIRVDALMKIEKTTNEVRPWEMFLDLADRLTHELVNANGFESDISLQMLHDRLLRARGILREESVLFEAAHGHVHLPLTPVPAAKTA